MVQRVFHGNLTPNEIASWLLAEFNHGNLKAQQIGRGKLVLVQISTREDSQSGGKTSMSVALRQIEDGVSIEIGKQTWLSIAASLGQSALSVWKNPFRLIERLDDIAQDIEYIQLSDQVWSVIDRAIQSFGASLELSERLQRLICDYCSSTNPINESNCRACGAPLGKKFPTTCPNCGFVVKPTEKICPNCKNSLT